MEYPSPEGGFKNQLEKFGRKQKLCKVLLVVGIALIVVLVVGWLWNMFMNKQIFNPIGPIRYGKHDKHSKKHHGLRECDAAFFVDSVMNGRVEVIIVFVAEECHHCRNLRPLLEEIASESDVEIMTVTWKPEKEWLKHVMHKYNIPGFPTIMKFGAYEPKLYDGPRAYDHILRFCNS